MAIILDITSHYMYYHRFKRYGRDFLVVQWLRFCIPSSGGLSLMLGEGTRSYMLQLRRGLAKKKRVLELPRSTDHCHGINHKG